MPTYEEMKDAELPEHFKAPVAKEPNMRRLQRFPGCWEWIVVPDDEYPARASADAPTAVKKSEREQSAPAWSGFSGDSDMTVRKEALLKGFEAREGTLKEKLIKVLVENLGKPVPTKQLLKAAYGNQNEENIGALRNVLKGITVAIEEKKLPVEVNHVNDEDMNGYGLYVS